MTSNAALNGRRRVVVTGLGALTPLGNDARSSWDALIAGESGAGPITQFDAAEFPVTRVEVWLDQRRMADGPSNNLTLDLTDVETGSYVLLVRVWDHDEVPFERARRIEIGRSGA